MQHKISPFGRNDRQFVDRQFVDRPFVDRPFVDRPFGTVVVGIGLAGKNWEIIKFDLTINASNEVDIVVAWHRFDVFGHRQFQ
jgi:hypothetical protein